MDLIKKVFQLINHWYLRYSLATELYMVEPWEKITIHVLYATIFIFFWYFNYSIILNGISQLRDSTQHVESIFN